MSDSRSLSTILPIYAILYLPAIKQYWKDISNYSGSRLELLWELNTLSGQLLAGKDYLLNGVFAEEIVIVKWILARESSLRLRLMVCLVIAIVFGVFKGQSLLIISVVWYIILKTHLRILAYSLIKYASFLHFLCTPGTRSPNHLFILHQDRLLIEIVERERYWWPHGWSSRLLRTDTLGNFTDASGCHGYPPEIIRDLQKRGYLSLNLARKGDWQYGCGDWQPGEEGHAETRWRTWQWEYHIDNTFDWDHIKYLYSI